MKKGHIIDVKCFYSESEINPKEIIKNSFLIFLKQIK